jgi:hypothetical protein
LYLDSVAPEHELSLYDIILGPYALCVLHNVISLLIAVDKVRDIIHRLFNQLPGDGFPLLAALGIEPRAFLSLFGDQFIFYLPLQI